MQGLAPLPYFRSFSSRERIETHPVTRTRKMAKKVLSFNRGALTLDTENYEVSKHGIPAVLTSTESGY
jgi:predicted nuclease with RNAse H fold